MTRSIPTKKYNSTFRPKMVMESALRTSKVRYQNTQSQQNAAIGNGSAFLSQSVWSFHLLTAVVKQLKWKEIEPWIPNISYILNIDVFQTRMDDLTYLGMTMWLGIVFSWRRKGMSTSAYEVEES
jgi:hypothetical protein